MLHGAILAADDECRPKYGICRSQSPADSDREHRRDKAVVVLMKAQSAAQIK